MSIRILIIIRIFYETDRSFFLQKEQMIFLCQSMKPKNDQRIFNERSGRSVERSDPHGSFKRSGKRSVYFSIQFLFFFRLILEITLFNLIFVKK